MDPFELLQEWVNADYNTLLSEGAKAFLYLKPYIEKYADKYTITKKENEANKLYILSISVARAAIADKKVTELEEKLIKQLFGFNEAQLRLIYEYSGFDDHKEFRRFVRFLDNTGKCYLLNLITSIVACDKSVNIEEHKFILEILKTLN